MLLAYFPDSGPKGRCPKDNEQHKCWYICPRSVYESDYFFSLLKSFSYYALEDGKV